MVHNFWNVIYKGALMFFLSFEHEDKYVIVIYMYVNITCAQYPNKKSRMKIAMTVFLSLIVDPCLWCQEKKGKASGDCRYSLFFNYF
jgi:hypothetical protein